MLLYSSGTKAGKLSSGSFPEPFLFFSGDTDFESLFVNFYAI